MSATFVLTRNGNLFALFPLGDATSSSETVTEVNETQDYGIEIWEREPDTEYQVNLGDVEASLCGNQGSNLPQRRGKNIEWGDARYFDGAYGLVKVRVLSREDGKFQWEDRLQVHFRVKSSKLTEDRYETMFSQLRFLAASLVFDLASKTLRSISLRTESNSSFLRTSLLELRVIQRLWFRVATILDQIALQPAKAIRRQRTPKRCFGGELLDSRALQQLARIGLDPRRANEGSFITSVSALSETSDLPENQMIRGFLEFLQRRLQECNRAIQQHIGGLESHKKWRVSTHYGERSLFESEDQPRIEKLREYSKSCKDTSAQIAQALSLDFLSNVRGKLEVVDSPVVRNLVPYRAFVQVMLDYLSTGIVILDDAPVDRIKSTHRMYEQWVFLQIVSAMYERGLRCIEQEGILGRSRSYRFTLDFDRGARVVFKADNTHLVSVRYEPWILPRDLATRSEDSVFRGGASVEPWSPDILIELLSSNRDKSGLQQCFYAVVVDAKYTARISDRHWESVGKYSQIRSTATGRQVGRQLWLAYPGSPSDDDAFPIRIRDSSVNWTAKGPDCAKDESIEGTLLFRPARSLPYHQPSSSWITRPEPAVKEFVGGVLSFFGVDIC